VNSGSFIYYFKQSVSEISNLLGPTIIFLEINLHNQKKNIPCISVVFLGVTVNLTLVTHENAVKLTADFCFRHFFARDGNIYFLIF